MPMILLHKEATHKIPKAQYKKKTYLSHKQIDEFVQWATIDYDNGHIMRVVDQCISSNGVHLDSAWSPHCFQYWGE